MKSKNYILITRIIFLILPTLLIRDVFMPRLHQQPIIWVAVIYCGIIFPILKIIEEPKNVISIYHVLHLLIMLFLSISLIGSAMNNTSAIASGYAALGTLFIIFAVNILYVIINTPIIIAEFIKLKEKK